MRSIPKVLPAKAYFRSNALKSVYRITLAFCTLLAAGKVFALSWGDTVLREQHRVDRNVTLYTGDSPNQRYASQLFILFDDSGMVSKIYQGNRCFSPDAAPDLSRIIVYDGNNQSGCLVILVMEDSTGPTDGFEEGGVTGRRVEGLKWTLRSVRPILSSKKD